MSEQTKDTKGLVLVNTGNGKGKTTAALGLVLRAWGNGFNILILQFIKGGWKYGELKGLAQLAPQVVVKQCGEGFTRRGDDQEKHKMAAQEALKEAQQEIASGKWDMVVLDEINYAIDFGLVALETVVEMIKAKPDNMHLVLTGRNAKPEIVELADLVTEMKEIKHPFKAGIKAQRGIEF